MTSDVKSLKDGVILYQKSFLYRFLPVQVLFFLTMNLLLILGNHPDQFAKFGTIIIAMSAGMIGRARWKQEQLSQMMRENIGQLGLLSQSQHFIDLNLAVISLMKDRGIEVPNNLREYKPNFDIEQIIADYEEIARVESVTIQKTWLFEISFIVIGTLITGYGADLVDWLHRL